MDEMRPLLTIEQFVGWLRVAAIVWTCACAAGGAAWGARKGAATRGLVRGLALGALGPVIWGAWHYYHWMIRYDPQTGYVGLHKVWVLVVNLVVFVVVGVLVGWGLRAVWERTANDER